MLSSRTPWIRAYAFVLLILPAAILAVESIGSLSSYDSKDVQLHPYKFISAPSRRIFAFRRNGIKVDIKVVPAWRNESAESTDDDDFPEFPTGDIGRCVLQFSLSCAKNKVNHFLDSVKELNEITLLGQQVKLVKARVRTDDLPKNDSDLSIQRSIDDFFETFALRITLPKWNGKRERNQIDVMLDETALAEARKKGGGGKGGGGGKCKMMMMAMVLMVKMKVMGFMAMKSMMMAGMSLMFTTFMLGQKFMKGGGGGGGPWQSGGGGGPWQGGGGGGGQLKEVVLLTKASGGGGGGGGSGCCGGGGGGGDSYGAPPPAAYGPPSGGGGYGGGGGGWGRSFNRRQMIAHDDPNTGQYAQSSNLLSVITNGNSNHLNYSDYGVQGTNKSLHNWTSTNYGNFDKYRHYNDTVENLEHKSVNEPLLDLAPAKSDEPELDTDKYITEIDPPPEDLDDPEMTNPLEKGVVDESLSTSPQNFKTPIYVVESNTPASSSPLFLANTNRPDVSLDTNVMRPAYNDEWEATAERIVPINAIPVRPGMRNIPTVPINHAADSLDLALQGI